MSSLNLILFTAENFKKRFDSEKKRTQVQGYNMDTIKGYVGEMLNFFIGELSQRMPELPEAGFTQLDRLIRDHREKEWTRISGGCESLRKDELTKVTTPEQLDLLMDNIEDYINQLKSMAYEVRYRVLTQNGSQLVISCA